MAPSLCTDDMTGTGKSGPAKFNSKQHLAYSPPSDILQMKDLGQSPTELSPVASTEPFPLLSHDAIIQHRHPGMAPRYASFIHEFWHSPEVLKIISDNAGVDLIPAMDYEISHTNVQLGPGGLDAVRKTPLEPPAATEEAISEFEKDKPQTRAVTDQTRPIIEWHRDSHPFVCVVMLSDARHMIGGETELKKADGSTLKVKAPQMGCAVILQGRYITHTAAPAANMPERVTIVTSFRPRNPTLLDETTNSNVRNKSHLTELYFQWTTYRLDVLAQRAQIAAKELREMYEKNVNASDPEGKKGLCRVETVNVKAVEAWVEVQMMYMKETLHEMRPLGQ
ncbi:hypothetical protein N7509_008351 [Penicillium cosmopolitanum]|uniref:Fe2OG dioxygenase domain-containing protein n=1 Tax=Penicillium cosmopolitanum TaxID=1131564 RepID=A0A9W9VMF5_9EURO|nr:uncharacterized protein N7509_008351 [Penicillium cosmopolitanum]KAJ5385810.1 hypothetical protein N7509_008351 [Penicillium cosmopolitanum]